jgi:RNA polymerase sigma-70 factor (ECF subfamily)
MNQRRENQNPSLIYLMALKMQELSMPSTSLHLAPEEYSDVELMKQLALGKANAMRELMRRHQPWVWRIAWRMVGNAATAEDLVQETFLRLFRSADRYKPDASLKTYLRRIVVNLGIDFRRSSRPAMALAQDDREPAAADSPDPLEIQERQQRVQKAIQKLPPRQRAALTLHRFENQSYREIAEVMDLSESAVESLVMRAYASLREALADLCENKSKV